MPQKKVDDYVEGSLELDEADITPAEKKATYQESQIYVFGKYGAKVSLLYISQIKGRMGWRLGKVIIRLKRQKQESLIVQWRKKSILKKYYIIFKCYRKVWVLLRTPRLLKYYNSNFALD